MRISRIVSTATILFAGIILSSSGLVSAASPIDLGTAGSFGVFGGSTVTNTGATVVNGNLGVSPGSSVVGFPPGIVIGTMHIADAVAAQAQTDLTAAYNAADSQMCAVDLSGQDLGGLTLTPGVYCFDTSAQLTGILTLNMQGNPNAVFIFKVGSTLTSASNSRVTTINSVAPSACNVFWQIGSSATLGTGTTFIGNIMTQASVTMTTGATLEGRALARTGAVTLDSNTITPTTACQDLPPSDGNGGGQGGSTSSSTTTSSSNPATTGVKAPDTGFDIYTANVAETMVKYGLVATGLFGAYLATRKYSKR